jgi:creatinine amidohydrolase
VLRSTDFCELTTVELDALLADGPTPVLLLPIGAVEPHGPHAPLGTDVLIATAICERTARALRGDQHVRALVLPALPFGVTRYAAAFRGAVSVRAGTLTSLIVELCASLAQDGLRRIVLVNHHFEPAHVAALRTAAEALLQDGELRVRVFDLTRRAQATRLTDEFRRGSCHAGSYETSLVLSERPDLIDTAAAAALPALEVDMPAAIAAGQTDFLAMGMDQAYCGAPADATAAEGDQTYAVLVEMLIELIRELVDAG